jgi:hypothetical protein
MRSQLIFALAVELFRSIKPSNPFAVWHRCNPES